MHFESAAYEQGSLARAWGHFGTEILVVTTLGAIAMAAFPLPPSAPVLIGALTLAVLTLATFAAMRVHDRQLCELCVTEMPLDAEAQAAKFRDRFVIAHLAEKPAVILSYFVIVAIGSYATSMQGPFRLVGLLVMSSLVYMILSARTHRRFQPWCPQCQGGDGRFDDVETPDPVPQGAA